MISLNWLPETAYLYLLIFARVGTILMLMPALGEQIIPARLRLSFALLFALVLYPLLAPSLPPLPDDMLQVLVLVLHELLVGFIIGGIARLVVSSTQVAGSVIAFQIGLSVAQSALGTLDRVEAVVKLLGMVYATPDFTDHPAVINGVKQIADAVDDAHHVVVRDQQHRILHIVGHARRDELEGAGGIVEIPKRPAERPSILIHQVHHVIRPHSHLRCLGIRTRRARDIHQRAHPVLLRPGCIHHVLARNADRLRAERKMSVEPVSRNLPFSSGGN